MSFFLRRIRNRSDAEDLTQEVFIRLAKSGAKMDSADAYIFQIAANLLKDSARSNKVRADYRLSISGETDEAFEQIDPHRVMAGREELHLLREGLRELPERTRNIFILSRIENMSRGEIGATFGLSVSAVEKHLSRAMKSLTLKLEAGK
jgi:RNA polymerase sigma-70 factor (ECF subfamily)